MATGSRPPKQNHTFSTYNQGNGELSLSDVMPLLQLRPAILELMTALFICIKNILLESLVTSVRQRYSQLLKILHSLERDPVNVEIMGYNNKEATKIKRKKASNETQESYIRMSLCFRCSIVHSGQATCLLS